MPLFCKVKEWLLIPLGMEAVRVRSKFDYAETCCWLVFCLMLSSYVEEPGTKVAVLKEMDLLFSEEAAPKGEFARTCWSKLLSMSSIDMHEPPSLSNSRMALFFL